MLCLNQSGLHRLNLSKDFLVGCCFIKRYSLPIIFWRDIGLVIGFAASAFEDANHLAKECAFTLSVWNQVCQWQGHSVIPRQHSALNLADWWDMLCHSSSGTMKKPAHNLVECLAWTQLKKFSANLVEWKSGGFFSKGKYRPNSSI